jgi:hypothetical protein
MGAGDYRSIVALGTYNNVGTMLNDSSVEPTDMQRDNTEHPSSHVPGHSSYRGNFYRIRSLHTPEILSVLFVSLHFNLPCFTLRLEMPTRRF